MNLYTLSKEMEQITNMGYDDETTQELLELYNIIGDDALDDVVKTIRTLEASIAGVSHEIERLAKIKASETSKIQSLHKLVSNYLLSTGKDRINTDYTKVYFTTSKQVIVDDENLLNSEYLKEKISTSIDKIAIKKDLQKGIIVEGARLQDFNNLQIK